MWVFPASLALVFFRLIVGYPLVTMFIGSSLAKKNTLGPKSSRVWVGRCSEDITIKNPKKVEVREYFEEKFFLIKQNFITRF